MVVRRCAMLFVELDAAPRFDMARVFDGGDGMDRASRWLAHAPHLREPAPVTLAQLAVLSAMPADGGMEMAELQAAHGPAVVASLQAARLLIADDTDARALACDDAARTVPWWPPALLAQGAGAWDGVDVEARIEAGLMPTAAQMVDANGPAPSHDHRRAENAVALPAPARRDFDDLLARRRTCRNFDAAAALTTADLATMLHRVWGATGTRELAPGAVAVKKTSPAGGGLHAVEAYLLVQRVDGLAPGLYHYLPVHHALETVRVLTAPEAADFARRFVAGQQWFADVPAMAIMTARFDRLFWKYRRHAKAWRVVHLDAGHLSQTCYLSAADLGLGAFVTAAINDREIETALSLPPLREAAIAIVGFGPRAATRTHIELDDLTPIPASQAASALNPPPDLPSAPAHPPR